MSRALSVLAAIALVGTIATTATAEPPNNGPSAAVLLQQKLAAAVKKQLPLQIMVLHATNGGGGIDPKIGPLPQLKKPPFSAYDTYRLLSRKQITLLAGQSDQENLPNERLLKTTLKAVLPDNRYQLATSISQPSTKDGKGKVFLPLLEVTAKHGETFFVAGQSYRGGTLVVGINVGATPPPPPPKR